MDVPLDRLCQPTAGSAIRRATVAHASALEDTGNQLPAFVSGNDQKRHVELGQRPSRLELHTARQTCCCPRTEGTSRRLRQQAELSLRRLRTDLLQLHRIDPAVPLADQVGALTLLRDEGKVRHIGLSEVSVAQLREAASRSRLASNRVCDYELNL